MAAGVVHPTRVAWDFAQVTVYVAEAPEELFAWYCDRMRQVLGDAYVTELRESRARLVALTRPDIHHVEIARWWPRIEDVLRASPDIASDLRALHDAAASWLAHHWSRVA